MIAVRLWGGLGNQLFQYAFGRNKSLHEKKDLFFYKIEQKNSSGSSALEEFNIDVKYLEYNEVKRYYKLIGNGVPLRFERKIISWIPKINKYVYIESGLQFSEEVNTTIICYDGYWQSYKYFNSIRELLLNEITLRNPAKVKSDLYIDILKRNSVSVHIRRGDYLSKSNRYKYFNCDSAYYQKAISYVKKMVSDPVFFIFSDDLSWVMENFTFFSDLIVKPVMFDFIPSASLELILMKSCKHNIIANSTFSWWGAWLNSKADKIVIAPAKWYFGRLNETTKDLIPSEWIRL
jgi:hypothetical protein